MAVFISSGRMRLRWMGVVAVGALVLQAGTVAAAESSRASVEVAYSPSLDLFNLLDNLPDWLPGYTTAAYQQEWQRRFGLDERDRHLLAGYAAFRRRTSPLARDEEAKGTPADRLFAGSDTRKGDPYTRHFLGAASFEDAAESAIAAQSRGDQALLRQYYARFAPRARRLLAAAQPFHEQQDALAHQLASPPVGRLADEMKAFFIEAAAAVGRGVCRAMSGSVDVAQSVECPGGAAGHLLGPVSVSASGAWRDAVGGVLVVHPAACRSCCEGACHGVSGGAARATPGGRPAVGCGSICVCLRQGGIALNAATGPGRVDGIGTSA
ncbi:hypothetical protein [Stenotrophomonas maltophilia]|uniref:hypothetical protein n=1 Tax=Stenotrophomonas maltophilia TaxID=40324 RepID=UPI001FF0AC57|nr:hypothetical protein [Stenotrophomonas maltophilia]